MTTTTNIAPGAKATATKRTTKAGTAVKPVSKAPAATTAATTAANLVAADTPAPALTKTMQPVAASRQMRHKELADRVAARTGMKKKDVKPVIQATLAIMGEVLAEQRGLILPPLGRIKLQRAKTVSDGRVLVLKLRQKDDQPAAATSVED